MFRTRSSQPVPAFHRESPAFLAARGGPPTHQPDPSLNFAICSFLITERRQGATFEELVDHRLAYRSASAERCYLERAIPQLVDEGLLLREGDRYLASGDSVADVIQHIKP